MLNPRPRLQVIEIVGNQISNVPLELLGEAGPMEVMVDLVPPEACQESRTDGPLLMHETLNSTAEKVKSVDMWEKETQVKIDVINSERFSKLRPDCSDC